MQEKPDEGGARSPDEPKAKKKKTSKAKPAKEKEVDLPNMTGPGVERPSYPKVEEAADAYAELRDERAALLAQEIEAKKRLIAEMQKAQQVTYIYGNRVVKLMPKDATTNVKVESKKDKDYEVDLSGDEGEGEE